MLEKPALVIGSPPPHGHDLDLLVRPAEERALGSILVSAGFVCQKVAPFRGYPEGFRIWARFRDCDADVVDAIPVGNLGLPGEEVERLFAEARPLRGFARLVRPAPHHVLLILAHDFLDPADGRRPLPAGRHERVRRALAEDRAAWGRARALAHAWGSRQRLVRLETAFSLDHLGAAKTPRSEPAPAGLRSLVQSVRAYRRAWRQGRIVGFSGLDGPKRVAQTEGLQRALESLDIPTRLERPPAEPALRGKLHALVKPRRRRPLLAHASALMAALGHAAAMRRAVLPGLRAGEIVICDGYTLDASVLLRVRYGEQSRFRLQTAVLRRLSPRPRRAYLIDSPGPPGTLYREQSYLLGVRRLSGTRARENLCAEVALDVWRAVIVGG
jgi:hypothetical protein